MKILFASRYVDPYAVGSNKNVYLQAQSLRKDFDLDVEILTWPNNDLWSGPLPDAEKQNPTLKVEREGLIYHVFTAPPAWNATAGGAAIPDHAWEQAVRYGMNILGALNPDIVHLQHRHGMWWILESAQRLGIPTVYTNHDWGIACMRTTLVTGNGLLCDGVVAPSKCAQCIKAGRSSVMGRVNEALVSTLPLEILAKLVIKVPLLGAALRQKGFVTEPALNRTRMNYARARRAISQLSYCITPSRFAAQFFSQLGIPAERINVLPWYHDPNDAQKKMVQDDQPFTITYIGRVSPEKGIDLIFSALEQLTNEEPVLLRVAGANDSPYCSALKNKYSKTVGKHSLEWLGWSEVGPLLQSTDVVIIPSAWIDNTPLALIEALASKVPVIATRIPPIEELVVEGETGFLTEYRSVNSLADGIRRALSAKEGIRGSMHQFPDVMGIKDYMSEVVAAYRNISAKERAIL
jgi:glycosyltransferase involved in cell wall biosynthesis